MSVTIIDLWVITAECHVCCVPGQNLQGIPIYEGVVLHNDYEGEWGGVPACKDCYQRQQLLTSPVELSEFRKGKDK